MNPGEEGAAEDPKPYRTPFAAAPDNPWWILPLLGRVPAVPPPKIQLLGVIALAILFENYDQAMLTAAAKQIAESFGLEQSRLAEMFGWVHLRGTASGWLQLSEAAGRSVGLFVVAWGTTAGGSAVPMLDWIVFASLGAGLVLLCVPETGRRELEEISIDR